MNCVIKSVFMFLLLLPFSALHSQVYFDDTMSHEVRSMRGGATWEENSSSNGFTYNSGGTHFQNRAILYSADAFQSEDGFKLTIEYTTGSIGSTAGHNFSFGLISDETDLSGLNGFNPFKDDLSVYSVGANLTAAGDVTARGLNFTSNGVRTNLDQSGTRVEFGEGVSTKVTIEIGVGGYWSYRINDEYEASGVLLEGFDLSKNYHVAVYGQDDHGGGKSIESIVLEKRNAPGERAAHYRGTWASVDHLALEQVKDFLTLDTLYVRFNTGASTSAGHLVPSRLLETLALEGYDGTADPLVLDPVDLIVPTWGDLTLDEPENDSFNDYMLAVKAAGFNVKAYLNTQQFFSNGDEYDEFVARWRAFCDNATEAVTYINSQPFHTGIWNSDTEQYEDATDSHPERKYMFCYVEFVLKDYALRYGHAIDSWIFDSAGDISSRGDSATSGVIEEQRIYQAFTNAVRAGNPDTAVAFNNGRSNGNYPSYPYAAPVRFEDFTFGHAFGGNGNHAALPPEGNQFNLNYQYISRMTATNGYVHEEGRWDWDESIVGNFHSKLGHASWAFSNPPVWQQVDFNAWNLEAMQAGGSMTWSGATTRVFPEQLYTEAYDLLKGTDDYLAVYESPGAPNWARAHTVLPTAYFGELYTHTLLEGIDFWDSEGDAITNLFPIDGPDWLGVAQTSSGVWTLSGTPTEREMTEHQFRLRVNDASGGTSRYVDLTVMIEDLIWGNGFEDSE